MEQCRGGRLTGETHEEFFGLLKILYGMLNATYRIVSICQNDIVKIYEFQYTQFYL